MSFLDPLYNFFGAILAFYGLLTVAIALARSQRMPPATVMWLPDAALLGASWWAMSRSASDLAAFPVLFGRSRRAAADGTAGVAAPLVRMLPDAPSRGDRP